MRHTIEIGRTLAVAMACTLLAACGGGTPAGRIASTASGQSTTAAEIDAIVAMLEEGKTGAAKKRISAGLKRDPNNPALMMLRDSITKKPEELLGPDSYRYTVRSGDTMSGLAQRFLGNRLKFYQLARYNRMDYPGSLRVGQVLNIPGKAPVPPPRQAAPSQPAQREKPKSAIAPTPAAPARSAANPAAAQQARSAGLAALNAGQPARAVILLSRAASLDPGNAVIARDLTRARRIAATVGSK